MIAIQVSSIIIITAALLSPLCIGDSSSNNNHLVVILLDGFRYDYAERMSVDDIPAFKRFMSEGARAEYVQTIFPSNSLPSWTTIATGLYPNQHGIFDNYLYDEESGKSFTLGDHADAMDPIWWKDHVPLWTTATQAGIDTSVYLWSYCDVPFEGGVLPKKCKPYGSAIEGAEDDFDALRINLADVVSDLSSGYRLSMVWSNLLDHSGHFDGPDSRGMDDTMKDIDAILGEFMDNLNHEGLDDLTDVVLVGDHGMQRYELLQTIPVLISKYLEADDFVKMVDKGTFSTILLTDPDRADAFVEAMSDWEGMRAHTKENIPDYLQVKDNEHVFDMLLISEYMEKVGMDGRYPLEQYLPQSPDNPWAVPDTKQELIYVGGHGWDDMSPDASQYLEGDFPNMRTVFMARGPTFKSDGTVAPFIKLVDEYQMFVASLGLTEVPSHEGSWSRVEPLLADAVFSTTKEPGEQSTTTSGSHDKSRIAGLIVALFLTLVHS